MAMLSPEQDSAERPTPHVLIHRAVARRWIFSTLTTLGTDLPSFASLRAQYSRMAESEAANATPGKRRVMDIPELRRIDALAGLDCLLLGLRDFSRAPKYGLFFGGVYALGGWLILALLTWLSMPYFAYPAAMGFALIAPFVAAGIYEVSRRLEVGQPLSWRVVLGTVWQQKGTRRRLDGAHHRLRVLHLGRLCRHRLSAVLRPSRASPRRFPRGAHHHLRRALFYLAGQSLRRRAGDHRLLCDRHLVSIAHGPGHRLSPLR